MRFNIGLTSVAAGLIPVACAPRMATPPPSAHQHEHASSKLPDPDARNSTDAGRVRVMAAVVRKLAKAGDV